MVSLDESSGVSACLAWPTPASSTPVRPPANATASDADDLLARLIETEIVPRLMLAHAPPLPTPAPMMPDFAADESEVDHFAGLMIALDLPAAERLVEDAIARGVPLEAVFLDLFSRTARRLGEMWLEDRCSFADVTVGLCGLQKLLRGFGRLTGAAQVRHDGNLALFAAVPGEQHTFGVMMLDCFFRQAGWQVASMPLCSAGEVLSELSGRHYLLAGFSVACEAQLEPLAALIRAARSASRNTALLVMAGGRLFIEDPSLVNVVGADLTAADGQQAVVATQHILWSTEQAY